MPMLIPEKYKQQARRRTLFFILFFLTSPFAFLGCSSILFALSPMQEAGFFHGEVRIENRSGENLTITPITTTYAEPRIIAQPLCLYRRDIPLNAGEAWHISYDTADFPLAGIILCREGGDCRVLEHTYTDTLSFDELESLPLVDESWLAVTQSAPRYNFALPFNALMVIMSLFFGFGWWQAGRETI